MSPRWPRAKPRDARHERHPSSELFELVRRAVPSARSDGPARLPVVLAGEPRRLAQASATARRESRIDEAKSVKETKRGDAVDQDAQDRQAWCGMQDGLGRQPFDW